MQICEYKGGNLDCENGEKAPEYLKKLHSDFHGEIIDPLIVVYSVAPFKSYLSEIVVSDIFVWITSSKPVKRTWLRNCG